MTAITHSLLQFIRDNSFGADVDPSDQEFGCQLSSLDASSVQALIAHVQNTYGLQIDDELLSKSLDSSVPRASRQLRSFSRLRGC